MTGDLVITDLSRCAGFIFFGGGWRQKKAATRSRSPFVLPTISPAREEFVREQGKGAL